MNDFDKIFMVQWIGPFFNLNELKIWERENSISNEFCLYLFSGKEFSKKTFHYTVEKASVALFQ